jgi:hypothetical protein
MIASSPEEILDLPLGRTNQATPPAVLPATAGVLGRAAVRSRRSVL